MGGGPSVGVMAVIVVAALRIYTDGNAGGRFRSNAAGAWNGVGKCWSGDSGGRFCARSGSIRPSTAAENAL